MRLENITETADALREGIARGYLSMTDAITWAKGELAEGRGDTVPLLGDLAIGEHQPQSRILLMLGQLAWGADPELVGRIAAGHLRERLADGRLEAPAAARAMYHLFRDGLAPDAEFETGARRFEDEIGEAERGGRALTEISTDMLRFLSRYTAEDAGEPTGADGFVDRDQLTLSVERVVSGRVEASVRLLWQGWSGRIRLAVEQDVLSAFASALRDFAGHESRSVRLEAGDAPPGGRIELLVREYGRARRAALGMTLLEPRRTGRSRRGNELRVMLPTEHELLGVFAADLAETLATGNGVARLRLLRRWPDEA
jgi:hypothetical protein